MTKEIRKRRPAVAALLSFVVIGLGQLYNGQLRRAVIFFTIGLLPGIALFAFSTFLFSFQGVMAIYFGALISVGVYVISVIDAFIVARRFGEVELRRYNRWYVYVPIILVTTILKTAFAIPAASYSIPSGAMMPTLLIGDYLFVSKNAYQDREPERGDVVVFRLPTDTSVEYIMRLVGLPGDRIQVKDGILHINGTAVKRDLVEDYIVRDATGNVQRTPRFVENLPNGKQHYILEYSDTLPQDNTPEYTVPEGHFFSMGDNRDRSSDSRFDIVGPVPMENLVGRAEVFYFSHDGSASWWQVWRLPQAIRFDRIGNIIE